MANERVFLTDFKSVFIFFLTLMSYSFFIKVFNSVADPDPNPDPDPVGSGFFGWIRIRVFRPGSGSDLNTGTG